MTVEELKLKESEIQKQVEKDYERYKDIWENDRDLVVDNEFFSKKHSKIDSNYINISQITAEMFENVQTIDDLLELVNSFKEEIKNLPYHKRGIIRKYSYYGEDYSEDYFVYEYLEFKPRSYIETRVKNNIRDYIKKELWGENINRFYVPCNIVQLFKEGSIDFKTMQNIAESTCKV